MKGLQLYHTTQILLFHNYLGGGVIMEQKEQVLSCRAAREIDMVFYLESMGYKPAMIRGSDHWYSSPLRLERTPSFKVNRHLNRWFDFGLGKGGNLIDFGIQYYNCSVSDLLKRLAGHTGIATRSIPTASVPDTESKVKITAIKEIRHLALHQYVGRRNIPLALALLHCKEIHFTIKEKKYFALGFANDLGGYELRNSFFKGCCAPKGITLIHKECKTVTVFEGFFDFLSYLILYSDPIQDASDFLILNSLSFFDSSIPVMQRYNQVNLFFDNNPAGKIKTAQALKMGSRFRDCSHRYTGYDDLNDYLCYGTPNTGALNTGPTRPP